MLREMTWIFGLLLGQRGVTLVARLVQVKVVASILGPAGMGVWSQAIVILESFRELLLLGMGPGFVNLVAERLKSGKKHLIKSLTATAMSVLLVMVVLGGILILFFSENFSIWIFGEEGRETLVFIAFGAGVAAASTQILLLLLQGLKQWKALFIAGTCGAVASSMVIVVITCLGSVFWAVAGILMGALLGLLIVGMIAWKNCAWKNTAYSGNAAPSFAMVKELAGIAWIMSLVQVGGGLCLLSIRSILINSGGESEAGRFYLAWVATEMLFGTLAGIIWSYSMPSIASRKEDHAYIEEVQNNTQLISLLVMTPISVIAVLTYKIWIPLISSSAFVEAGQVIAFLFLGKWFEILRQCLNTRLIPFRRHQFYLVQFAVLWAPVFAISLLSVSQYGAAGIALGFLAGNTLTVVLAFIYHRVVFQHRVASSVRRLLPASLLLLLLAVFNVILWEGTFRLLPWIAFAAWIVWAGYPHLVQYLNLRRKKLRIHI